MVGSAVVRPVPVAAQQSERARRVGILLAAYTESDRAGQARIATLRAALGNLGWQEGRNIRFDYRWSGGNLNARDLAAELVEPAPGVIVVAGDPALTQLRGMTSTIPIVFTQVPEPVDSGFVASLAQPGGHIVDFQNFEPAIGGKWLGLLKETAPQTKRVGAMFSKDAAPHGSFFRAAEMAAPSLGVTMSIVDVWESAGLERGISAFAGEPDGGLLTSSRDTIGKNHRIGRPAARTTSS